VRGRVVEEPEPTMAEAMADALENLGPVIETADGIKERLVGMNWESSTAEAVAAAFVVNAMSAFFE